MEYHFVLSANFVEEEVDERYKDVRPADGFLRCPPIQDFLARFIGACPYSLSSASEIRPKPSDQIPIKTNDLQHLDEAGMSYAVERLADVQRDP